MVVLHRLVPTPHASYVFAIALTDQGKTLAAYSIAQTTRDVDELRSYRGVPVPLHPNDPRSSLRRAGFRWVA